MDRRGRGAATAGAWVLGACAMAACTPNATGGGGAGFGGVDQEDTADEDTSAGSGTTAGASQGSADGTGGTGNTGDATNGATTNPPPPPPPDTGDPTTSASTGEDVPPPPQEELLERADFDGCNEPLWCYVQPNVFNPAGGSMWMQECFSATLPPPFELVELEVVVRGLAPQVTNVDLEVYAYEGAAGPGVLLGSRDVNVAGLVLGTTNTIAVEPPIPITTQANVCIGLAAPDAGLAGSLGVAVNEGSTLSNASFFRLQGGGGCSFPGWTDVLDVNPNPAGNWCIRGTIRELQ